jgi:hypothetical protein
MEEKMSTLANVPNYTDRAVPMDNSARRANWIALARWLFLLIGTAGVLAGSWVLLGTETANEDGRRIAFAGTIALLTGLFLIIDVLRTGTTAERRS